MRGEPKYIITSRTAEVLAKNGWLGYDQSQFHICDELPSIGEIPESKATLLQVVVAGVGRLSVDALELEQKRYIPAKRTKADWKLKPWERTYG